MERRKDHAPSGNWQDFEDLCLKLWRLRLIDAKKNGRAGQPQAGVDIFGRDPKTEAWVGIRPFHLYSGNTLGDQRDLYHEKQHYY